jgi:hypothetical protein
LRLVVQRQQRVQGGRLDIQEKYTQEQLPEKEQTEIFEKQKQLGAYRG